MNNCRRFTCCIFIHYFLFLQTLRVYVLRTLNEKRQLKHSENALADQIESFYETYCRFSLLGYKTRKLATTYRGVSIALLSCYSNFRINQDRRYPGTAYKLECKVFERKFLRSTAVLMVPYRSSMKYCRAS